MNVYVEGFISSPTRFGRWTTYIFDEYPVYTFKIPSEVINYYFPDKIYSFTSTKYKSLAKRWLFYSTPAVRATRRQLSDNQQSISELFTLTDILQELLSEKNSNIRYNFVIMDDCLIFIQVPSIRHVSYYALCKHIVLTNRAQYVRFAGEMWHDEDKNLFLSNNSGTYRSSDELIKQAVNFFDHIAPELPFEGVSFRTSAQPSLKKRFSMDIKRKIRRENEQHNV